MLLLLVGLVEEDGPPTVFVVSPRLVLMWNRLFLLLYDADNSVGPESTIRRAGGSRFRCAGGVPGGGGGGDAADTQGSNNVAPGGGGGGGGGGDVGVLLVVLFDSGKPDTGDVSSPWRSKWSESPRTIFQIPIFQHFQDELFTS